MPMGPLINDNKQTGYDTRLPSPRLVTKNHLFDIFYDEAGLKTAVGQSQSSVYLVTL